jgi:large subunit ribosomal protein L15
MLDRLKPNPGSRRKRTRVGRGIAAGRGKTAGRGQKGAGARSGHRKRAWYEGGQMPLMRRLPKGGFTNLFRVTHQVVNLRELAKLEKGSVVDPAALHERSLISRADRPVKVLGSGELKQALVVRVDAVSASARAKIEAAGGSVELVPTRRARSSAAAKRAGGAGPDEGASS